MPAVPLVSSIHADIGLPSNVISMQDHCVTENLLVLGCAQTTTVHDCAQAITTYPSWGPCETASQPVVTREYSACMLAN